MTLSFKELITELREMKSDQLDYMKEADPSDEAKEKHRLFVIEYLLNMAVMSKNWNDRMQSELLSCQDCQKPCNEKRYMN